CGLPRAGDRGRAHEPEDHDAGRYSARRSARAVTEQLVGLGLDVHVFAAGRPLLLGGIGFEGEGLAGHSDGDVVCHALADALLGAVALGDVGEPFPDTDPAFAGIAGLDLLGRVVAMVRDAGARPVSADLTIVAELPSIAPARGEMRPAVGGPPGGTRAPG